MPSGSTPVAPTDGAAKRGPISVRVAVRADLVPPLRWLFGSGFEANGPRPDGTIEATVSGDSAAAIAGMLAGFGRAADPIEPPADVADELRRIAAELADRWLR